MGPICWSMRLLRLILATVAIALIALPGAASGATVTPAGTKLDVKPPGFSVTGNQALAIAKRQPAFAKVLRQYPHAYTDVGLISGPGPAHWQVVGAKTSTSMWLVDVSVGPNGAVTGLHSGLAASDQFVRGHFDRLFEKPWVWLTFGVLFLVPFVDPRRLRRMLHLDLLVLLSFGVSYAALNTEHPELAIKLFYPPLLYLLTRMLWAGRGRSSRPRGRLVPLLPTAVLLVGVIGLFGARVALNVSDHQSIDIGFMSVVGADRINHGLPLYVDNATHGDTYGPINYVAYVPFVAVFGWSGTWDRLPAAHAAAIFFDLMALIGLFVLGLRFRAGPEGRRLGLALAWAWAACPFTLLTLMQSANDSLVAMFLVATLLLITSAPARGAMLGLAAAAKFSPGGLLLLLARGRKDDGPRQWVQAVAACVALFAFCVAIYLPSGGLREFWNCTMGYQLHRLPDFSFWTLYPGAGLLQTALEIFGVGVAVAVALIPSRRGLTEVAALAAAVLIAVQLPAGHWFYFYISWFAPLVFVALFTAFREPAVAAVALPAGAEDDVASEPPAPLALAS